MPGPELGRQLSGSFEIDGGEARLFESGIALTSSVGEVQVHFDFPGIGRPMIRTGTGPVTLNPGAVRLTVAAGSLGQARPLVQSVIESRLSLAPVGTSGAASPLEVGDVAPLDPGNGGDQSFAIALAASGLESRQLYDIVMRSENGRHLVAPHALYYRDHWHDFGLAHITDMHVARRIDSFRGLLRAAGRHTAADKLYNWNDRFRGFVRYANYLHSIGKLDLILATGDLYDYIYEDDDDPDGGGNAEFLQQLVLGKAPGPEFPDVEELRVPICVVPGNHDYRRNPYRLIFDLNFGVGGLNIKDLEEVGNFFGYHILKEDAVTLASRLEGSTSDYMPNYSPDEAGRMVEIDKRNIAYERFIGAKGSYVLDLGPHRIVMLDTEWDTGVMDDLADGVRYIIGQTNEDERTFVGGSPNSEGISADEYQTAVEALENAPADGLVIVGLHAPLFNMPGNEYPYFMRESQRAPQGEQPEAWLARLGPGGVGMTPETVRQLAPTWFPAEHDHREVRFVKRGNTLDGLDNGVARDHADELVRRLAGVDCPRPADLVLAGHTHKYNEFRVRAGADGELVFYMDFYTNNPASYYPARFTVDWETTFRPATEVSYVDVVPGAQASSSPWPMPGGRKYEKVVQVPPYANPLNSASDKRQWWSDHRPLVLQTGALGPLENSQVSFSGFRILTVESNVIQTAHFIPTARLEAHGYVLPWEEAIRTDSPPVLPFLGRSEQYRMPASASSPSACVVSGLGVHDIIYREPNGRLLELWRDDQGGTGAGDLTGVSHAPLADGDPSPYVDTVTNQIILPYRGQDGTVHSLYWSTGAVGHDNLSGTAGSPPAAGDPRGFFRPEANLHHVIYRSADGHLHALYWHGAETVQHEDLMSGGGFPAAAGDPAPYYGGGYNIVAYRGVDNQIHSIYWSDGPAGHDALSAFANTPKASGDPVAYYIAQDDMHQITYRGEDGHLYELWSIAANPVAAWNLTGSTGAPPSASDPAAFFNAATNTKHVIYRSVDGRLNELSWTPGAATHVDLTTASGAPLASQTPTAFAVPMKNTKHVVYRGQQGHIYEIVSSYTS